MVKRLSYPLDYDRPVAIVIHVGWLGPYGIGDWHLVHEYTAADNPVGDMGGNQLQMPTDAEEALLGHPPLYSAHLAALGFAAHPQVIRDWCNSCRFWGWSGQGQLSSPRWNIYRGQRGENLIPCIYWDWYAVDPPPGFSWTPWAP